MHLPPFDVRRVWMEAAGLSAKEAADTPEAKKVMDMLESDFKMIYNGLNEDVKRAAFFFKGQKGRPDGIYIQDENLHNQICNQNIYIFFCIYTLLWA